jgi:hypothetical protein
VECVPTQVAESQMHHPRRRLLHHDPMGEFSVLRDDYPALLLRFPSQVRIWERGSKIARVD